VFKDPSIVDLTLITDSLHNHPLLKPVIAYPYYILFSAATIYHTCYGIQKSWTLLTHSAPRVPTKVWKPLGLVGLVWMSVTVLAVAGWFEEVHVVRSKDWHALHEAMFQLLGISAWVS
jgi:hypothetical protein